VLERKPDRFVSRGKWLRRAFFLLQRFLEVGELPKVIEVIDQLKLSYADGFSRPNEPLRLTALLVHCLQTKHEDIATILFDCFTPFIKNQSFDKIAVVFEQFIFISSVFVKHKQYFICDKSANLIFDFCEKNGISLNESQNRLTAKTSLTAFKRLGCLAMRHDPDLFYEILIRTAALFKKNEMIIGDEETSILFFAWVHKSARNDQTDVMLRIFYEFEQLLSCGRITEAVLYDIILECGNLAETFSNYTESPICSLIIQQLLSLSYLSQSMKCMRQAIVCAGKVNYLAIHKHGFRQCFSLLRPLADCGRKLLNETRKFGYSASNNDFEHQILLSILKENLSIVEYSVQQENTLTVGDVILWLFQSWQNQVSIGESKKSIQRFNQLFYIYWQQVNSRQAKYDADMSELMVPLLFTEEQTNWLLQPDISFSAACKKLSNQGITLTQDRYFTTKEQTQGNNNYIKQDGNRCSE